MTAGPCLTDEQCGELAIECQWSSILRHGQG